MNHYEQGIRNRLRAITTDCRPDMHEPDEQGIKCRVIGDHLDNAFGNSVITEHIVGGFQEFVVVLERLKDGKIVTDRFNLADLIALARRAQ